MGLDGVAFLAVGHDAESVGLFPERRLGDDRIASIVQDEVGS